jgi:hypothetical protein
MLHITYVSLELDFLYHPVSQHQTGCCVAAIVRPPEDIFPTFGEVDPFAVPRRGSSLRTLESFCGAWKHGFLRKQLPSQSNSPFPIHRRSSRACPPLAQATGTDMRLGRFRATPSYAAAEDQHGSAYIPANLDVVFAVPRFMVFRLRRARGNTHEDDEVLPNQPDPVSPEVGRLAGGSVAGLGGCRRLGGHNTGTGG